MAKNSRMAVDRPWASNFSSRTCFLYGVVDIGNIGFMSCAYHVFFYSPQGRSSLSAAALQGTPQGFPTWELSPCEFPSRDIEACAPSRRSGGLH